MCVSAETIRYDVMSLRAREAIQLARVVLAHRLCVRVGYVDQHVGEDLAAVRPGRVVVREAALPHQLGDTDHLPRLDRDAVADDARPALPLIALGRLFVLLVAFVPGPRPGVV